ncbi:glycosyltransferase [Paenibacillus xylanilyticus]|uniref:Glycosyltransferase family 2 protein n=1 Tax=Paenibacillus xylanilyticus TaxID=248903 RepID=A0A7Y6C048_9BACL|nr:glycosyltransferase [Paenibacillus xylanilyticus]NUU77360.1 glycosyltransferase family 2 protein [Paenibacillus xylanilyticus]
MATSVRSHRQNAVSILVCTKRRQCMHNLFHNYSRQNYKNKELIVILNNDKLKVSEYIKAANQHKNVRVLSLPENVSLGHCLNHGAALARHGLIAKFDDDDYYAPGYLTDSVQTLLKTNADIVGKRAHYMYLNSRKLLLLRYPAKAKQYVPLIQGATLLAKRNVITEVGFRDKNRGECVTFCSDSLTKGYKIYAGSPSNFLAIRRRNSADHTWIVSDKDLLTKNVKVLKVKNPRKFVCEH